MKKLHFKYLILSALILSAHLISTADVPYKVDGTASKMVILGTSSVHDWEIEVADFSCDAAITNDASGIVKVSDVSVVCEVKNVKSDNKIMDGKTYKALEGDKHPKITFKSAENISVSANTATKIKGQLSIAGKTKEVELPFTLQDASDSTVKIAGKMPVKMSDFGIDPPTAMMGALKTGDEVVISYDLTLKKSEK